MSTADEVDLSTQAGSSSSVIKTGKRHKKERTEQAQQLDDEIPKKKRQTEIPDLLEVDLTAPEPKSKAELRAARKKAKHHANGSNDEEGAGAANDGSKKKRSKIVGEGKDEKHTDKEGGKLKKQNSVWIGNLSFRTTLERLKEFFNKGVKELGGSEESVTRVNMPTKPGHGAFAQNKGFAYVDFVSPESQALAVSLTERLVEGRKVLIKLGDDFKADPNARTPKPLVIPGLGKQTNPESATLFVGNLPFDATEEGLRDMIEGNALIPDPATTDNQEDEDEDIGEKQGRGGKNSGLRKVRLGAFEDTGRCKGFAFLDFNTAAFATKALLNKKNRFMAGRKLQLEYASEEASKRSGTGRVNPSEGKARGGAVKRKVVSREAGHEKSEDEVETKIDKRGKKWEAAGRPRPGAALAMAKRENVSIVVGAPQNEKITFE
ncbi:hypothetical protein TREMEDRAFT_68494 [Tremella mesenterica DSM 1558]|uniref:uncharacterized protein n=1 Tax=Tremella mesenterica (strain ATCC 24925 / CBS 8224 / DSM 1558 / NBRC 9311 / NRRL Y-6157 / RJB 2259-6 / UBC 559-6) TaxID=578456 RepID=UPI0003F4A34B|nr:uncharacterized protein TREMEDRAFT_68494 [Tremella mesenterica DSM 1558]EIW70118.1 hypothetical protein TREMEDRAFT_68494 [Tremella mesenterica DSM 1558]